MLEITRSSGVPISIDGMPTGYVAGGGYSGATPDLDAMVEQAAAVLADYYGIGVTIRFNSDRRSGGAWLVTHAVDGVGANAEIGICAGYYPDHVVPADVEGRLAELRRIAEAAADSLPGAAPEDRFDIRRRQRDAEMRIVDLEVMGWEPGKPRLCLFAHIGNASLASPEVANSMEDEPSRRYAHVQVCDLTEALSFLVTNAVLHYTHDGERVPLPGLRP